MDNLTGTARRPSFQIEKSLFSQKSPVILSALMAYTNKRRSARCTFVLTAELTDEQSHTLIARLRNLNLHGCYIELGNPLPEGSAITIKVTAGKTSFEARGKVIYSEALRGSGVEFQEVEPHSQSVLESWLSEAEDLNSPEELIS